MPDNPDFESGPSRVGALLAECRQRLSEHETITVSAADAAIRHFFAIGLQINDMEDHTDNPELRARIERAIREADAAILELRRMVYEMEDRSQPYG